MLVEQIEWIKFLLNNINVTRRKNISYKKRKKEKKKKQNVLKIGEYWRKQQHANIFRLRVERSIKFITIFPIIVTMLNKKTISDTKSPKL